MRLCSIRNGRASWPGGSHVDWNALFITNLRIAWGEDKAMDYFKKLKDQKIVNFGSGSARTLVDRTHGRRISDRTEYFRAPSADQQSQGRPGQFGLMDPVATTAATMGIPKGAHHPYSAMLLIDFILSEEGQQIMAKAQYFRRCPTCRRCPNWRR